MSQEISESFCKDIIKKYDKKKLKRPVYVIQEHHAKRLHWDLRFEFDNALKSWALPKSPPMIPGGKRLAVAVDDHPLEYALFEGTIPEGNYGAGQVKTWDIGTYDIKEKESKKIVININGKKLKGDYCLLHFRPAENNWLFFKIKDDKETL
jgi:DNA ligase D-like protein (predicted 3'-phosphoesterase)